jgi:hypothetical protein
VYGSDIALLPAVDGSAPAAARIGPFQTRGAHPWLFPNGLILLAVAIVGYAWLVIDLVFSPPLVCRFETAHVLAFGLLAAAAFGCLAASTVRSSRRQLFIGSVAGLVMGVGSAVIVALLYGTQCTPFQRFIVDLVTF